MTVEDKRRLRPAPPAAGPGDEEQRIQEALDMVQLGPPRSASRTSSSGGQRSAWRLARALIRRPQVLAAR